MNKRLIVAVVCVVGVAVLWFGWVVVSRPNITNHPSSGETVIAFGDSLTAGEGVAPAETYPAVLAARLGLPVVNAGVSGDTTALARARLPALLAEYPRPKLTIVMLGGNDFLQRLPKAETSANLAQIIQQFQATGAIVVLVGVRGGIFSDAFASEYERLSREYHTAYVSNILGGILGEPSLKLDAIHPNARGYAKFVDRLEPVVRVLLR